MNKEGWPKLVAHASKAAEFLVDRQIRVAIHNGQLITGDTNDASTKYACYELRIGRRIQELVTDGELGGERDLYREKAIPDDGSFSIRPGQTFKIHSLEELSMPADVLAITIPVGNLYKLGLNPETSFADPGFAGEFFVTVCNYSARVVKLRVGEPLARIFFFHLTQRPERIHDSKPRDLPPAIERVRRPSRDELIAMGDEAVLQQVLREVDPPHYEHVFVTERIVSLHQRKNESRFGAVERYSATTTLLSLASLLLVLAVTVFYFGSLLRHLAPSFFDDVLAKLLVTIAFWAVPVFLISPVRRASLSAIRVLLTKG